MSIAMAGVTSMLIMSMRAQEEVNADCRSQLDARQVLYDMEKNIAEANGAMPRITNRYFRRI